jgi:hypothetical protein
MFGGGLLMQSRTKVLIVVSSVLETLQLLGDFSICGKAKILHDMDFIHIYCLRHVHTLLPKRLSRNSPESEDERFVVFFAGR